MQKPNQRNRGYLLTDKGLQKLEDARREWQEQNAINCTQEKMKELTEKYKTNGLDITTIREILNRKRRTDEQSIKVIFQAFKLKLNDDDITRQIKIVNSQDNSIGKNLMYLSTKIIESLGFDNFERSEVPQSLQSIRYRTKINKQEAIPYKLILYCEKESLCISIPSDILEPHLLKIKYWEYSDAVGEPVDFIKDLFWVLPSKKDIFLDSLNDNYLHLLISERKTVGDCYLNSIKRYEPPVAIQWQRLYDNTPDPDEYYVVSSTALEEYNPETFSQKDSYLVFTVDKRFETWNFYKVSISSEEIIKEFFDYFGKILIDKNP